MHTFVPSRSLTTNFMRATLVMHRTTASSLAFTWKIINKFKFLNKFVTYLAQTFILFWYCIKLYVLKMYSISKKRFSTYCLQNFKSFPSLTGASPAWDPVITSAFSTSPKRYNVLYVKGFSNDLEQNSTTNFKCQAHKVACPHYIVTLMSPFVHLHK